MSFTNNYYYGGYGQKATHCVHGVHLLSKCVSCESQFCKTDGCSFKRHGTLDFCMSCVVAKAVAEKTTKTLAQQAEAEAQVAAEAARRSVLSLIVAALVLRHEPAIQAAIDRDEAERERAPGMRDYVTDHVIERAKNLELD